MTWATAEEKRIQTIESALAVHATAIKNLASKKQLTHILSLLENQITEIQATLTSLQSQLNALKK